MSCIQPIHKLLFDEKIADMVEANGKEFPSNMVKCLYATDTFPLDQERLDNILEGWKDGEQFPPISVKKQTLDRYQVLNGRHRVCAAILKGDNYLSTIEINK